MIDPALGPLDPGAIDRTTLWVSVTLLALGTYVLRTWPLFLGGRATASPLFARALRYVPAAVMPALAAPLIAFDAAGAVQSDPARLAAAGVAVLVGLATRSVLWTIVAGLATLWIGAAALAGLG